MLFGIHVSTAGGLHKALDSAAAHRLEAFALFLRNQVQWKSPPLSAQTVRAFRAGRRRLGVHAIAAHASYLVNLAGDAPIRAKSIRAMSEDLRRCGRLGIEYLVVHPGSHPDLDEGLTRIAAALDEILSACPHRRPKILLETTAGQGNCIGHRFEHLAAIRRQIRLRRRVGVCLDTCHVFAAGYDLRTGRACRKMLDEFDRVVGLEHLRVVHLNDSKRPLGSRVDRHEHIGRGRIGRRGFAALLTEPRLADVPGILETPKGFSPSGRDLDRANLATLRRLGRAARA
ncbi:MAG TPA: deoxyribonuclease IV [Phycisphaerales bacterium]|nr:deoxyribonuclease IV [Phycisphaerales bacterium]